MYGGVATTHLRACDVPEVRQDLLQWGHCQDRHPTAQCMDPSGVGPRMYFQRVPEGKVVKNRVHLDVRVGTGLVGEERVATLEAECARLVALGAGVGGRARPDRVSSAA
ncbi:VOC family protein [Streptomyces inhibens]|uniref:VOC family protein n=1 Tax=Streptomyces inhibens TaxID=2293571 RepID=UPI00379ED60B